ncbi:hypothetical protein B0H67DRAFT_679517, partial [Lasiosphaeris hirsuta]
MVLNALLFHSFFFFNSCRSTVEGKGALWRAVDTGDAALIARFASRPPTGFPPWLSKRYVVSRCHERGETAIHLAVRRDDVECVKAIYEGSGQPAMEEASDPRPTCPTKQRPIDLAKRLGRTGIYDLLLYFRLFS